KQRPVYAEAMGICHLVSRDSRRNRRVTNVDELQEVIEADASEIGGPKGDIGIIIRYDDRITARYMGIDANQIGIGRCGNVDDVHCRPRSYEHLVFVWKDRFDVPVQLKA